MTTVTSRRADPAADALKHRRALCDELLKLDRKISDDVARMEAIKVELKAIATTGKASFKEEFAGRGSVAVSPAKGAEYKGKVPQVVAEKWLALKEAARNKLLEGGVVALIDQWGKATNGSVTVKPLTS